MAELCTFQTGEPTKDWNRAQRLRKDHRIESIGVPMRSEVHVYIVLAYSQAPKVCFRRSTDPINGKQMSQKEYIGGVSWHC